MKTYADRSVVRRMVPMLATGLCALVVAACGGGGSGGAGSSQVLAAAATTAATTGTSASSAPAAPATPQAPNVTAIVVDGGPAGVTGSVNIPFVSVKVCAPGSTSACQVIDHIMLDTGSSGLRLVASVLTNLPALGALSDASNNAYAECAQFIGDYTWGSVKLADVSMADETASSVPVQVIGDPAVGAAPATCSNAGAPNNTVTSLGANGMLGVESFREDCGSACVSAALPGAYYACPAGAGACSPTAMPLARQVGNPVARFASDNNGVLIALPAIPAIGAINVSGSLVFGIGTRSNNALGGAHAYGVDGSGNFTTTFNGHTYANSSFIDSGSNYYFFNSTLLPMCSDPDEFGFYCPASTQVLTAVVQGTNGTNGAVSFSVANAEKQFNGNPFATAFSNIAGDLPGPDGFDWGLPFFYGRNVFTALEGASTPAGMGPFVAY
ncbi:DUF3443 domain-containing protein [Variovorax sp. dw_308]|uniref:DUF3443 domain-containing protein n=1 Tax=Variovorax sp. dw_308 TaxID=2721546 RepID=UPI0021089CFD|nr:DUF3443 domain-containing protein [Variovorax sp. dw_308]